jgi:hypothetical protein
MKYYLPHLPGARGAQVTKYLGHIATNLLLYSQFAEQAGDIK